MPKINSDTEQLAQQMARRIVLAFSGTYKKRNLYTAGHSVYLDALHHFKKNLDEFVERFGHIRLRIEKEQIFYGEEAVYQGTSEPADLVFILRRDGILWIEFRKGLELYEIDTLLSVMHDHCVLEEDAEDDIVTALWGLNLPSIAYAAADLELGLDNDIRIKDLPCCPPHSCEVSDINAEKEQNAGVGLSAAVLPNAGATHEHRHELYPLSRNERMQLEKMVAAEEKLDGSDYVVDVLLYIIENQSLPEDVNDLLKYMTQAMREALLKLRFSYLQAVLTKVKTYLDTYRSMSHWSVPYLDRFILNLSSKAFLQNLLQISPQIEQAGPDTLNHLKTFLLLLDSETVTTIAPLMFQSQSAKLQQILVETITVQAKQDFRPLERLIFSRDKRLAGRLVSILRFFSDQQSHHILTKLLLDESAIIRQQALKVILWRDAQSYEKFFMLIDDPDESVRKLLLKHLGRKRNAQAERLLLNYLQSGKAGVGDPDHFIAVYKTLGKCASDQSLPYLKKCLFKWPRLGILRYTHSIHYQTALIALKTIGTKNAADLIDRADQGFLKNLFRPA